MMFSRSRLQECSSDGVLRVPNTSSIPSSSSSSSSRSWKYDLFISFRGEDTRKTFVGHLCYALQQHGILTYKDDVTLDRGDTIRPSLLEAIQQSQIALIIFSERYAESSWCLDELSYIMKCKEEKGQIVMPIFYNVDPSDVRKQEGQFGKAFAKHKLSKNNKVELWKKDLVDASNIAGWEPKHVANGHEAKCIQEIVDSISDKLSSLNPVVDNVKFVGMQTRLKDLKSLLRIGSGGVRMVGIWGIGGGGKTTLATSLYMELSASFDGCCFLGNIREVSKQQNGLQSLQEKILSTVFDKKLEVQSVDIGKHMIKSMLCRRNVLIVLDDIDHLDQLEALAGRHNWFGNGSRIIISTRNEQLLISHRVDEVSPLSLLSHNEAIQLFRIHAYRDHDPVVDYEELSLHVISYVNGLPLALKILGSFLYGRDKVEWLSTLARLKDHPETDIVEKLKISYDGLKDVEKELFLEIACFYRGTKENEAMQILDACGFYPHIGVKVLIQKALITVSKGGEFDMHDLVQEMAHHIVRGEHPNNPEKHSRLWREEDVEDICSRNATMKLRFLAVRTRNCHGEGPDFLSHELRYIHWECYSASLFPESFQPTKLMVLKMKGSLQKELWKGYKYLPCLKELQLEYSRALDRTPDFSGLPCLQKLVLVGYESLEEIHQSLGYHTSLVYLSVVFCRKLKRFPNIVGMKRLEILKISSCLALVEFPKIEAKMDNLKELRLEQVGIQVLPSSVAEYCTNLISLELKLCPNLKSIEGNFHALKYLENFDVIKFDLAGSSFGIGFHLPHSLKKLNLRCCGLKDGEIPDEIGELSNLQELHLCWNEFTRLHFSLSRLTSLKFLELSNCENLVELPELPANLAGLRANYCSSLEAIREDVHRNCKWLCKIEVQHGMKNIKGGERLLETMLRGNGGVESGCMHLKLQGSEISRGFIPRLVRGKRCRMQLPENWNNDFSGFLFCVAFDHEFLAGITMKHVEKLEECRMGTEDSLDDVYLEESVDEWKNTWVGYIPFSLLRQTSWWDPTSTAVEMEINKVTYAYGFKLIHKTSETSLFDNVYDDYTSLGILHDSKSAFKFCL